MPKLKPTLNQADMEVLTKLIYQVTHQVVSQEVAFQIKEALAPLEEKISHLPTKEEFYKKMDEIMGVLQDVRQEQALLCQHDVDQQEELDKLKALHPNFQHP